MLNSTAQKTVIGRRSDQQTAWMKIGFDREVLARIRRDHPAQRFLRQKGIKKELKIYYRVDLHCSNTHCSTWLFLFIADDVSILK